MSDAYEHNIGDHEDPLAGSTWLIMLIGSVLLVVIMLGLTALYYTSKNRAVETEIVAAPVQALLDLRAVQNARLTGAPRWEKRDDAGNEITAFVIPIDRAIEITAREFQSQSRSGQ